jgi:hypothetical protein
LKQRQFESRGANISISGRIAMKKVFLMAAIAPVMVGSAAAAGELPNFELMGFPITRHQVAVMGAQGVQEQSAAATLTFGGMPASPHQIAILTPRAGMTAKAAVLKRTTVGLAAE